MSALGIRRTFVACVLLGGWVSTALADPLVISNLALLDELTRASVTEIAEELTIDPAIPVTIFSSSPHEGNEIVKRYLGAALAERGHPVTVVIGPGEKPAPVVETAARPGPGAATRPAAAGGPANQQPAGASGASVDTTGAGNEDEDAAGAGSPAEDDSTSVPSAESVTNEETSTSDEASANTETSESVVAEGVSTNVHSDAPIRAIEVTNGMTLPEGRYPDGVCVDVRIREFGVRYAEVSRRLLVGPVQFTRIGGVYLEASVLRGSHGNLAQTATAQRHHWDRISGRTRALCEGVSYPYAAPELKTPPVSRYVEPAVVTGIVGSLIYLFYTNQN